MCKNSLLIFFAFILPLSAAKVLAQADMDLMLFDTPKSTAAAKKSAAKNGTLSDALADNEAKKEEAEEKPKTENWLMSLINSGTSSFSKTTDKKAKANEEKRLEKVMINRRSNAANLDISHIKLRMTPEEVHDMLKQQGFRQIMQLKEIPNFIKWRSEELCRINGVVGFERLNMCATNLAEQNGLRFIEHEKYNRHSTREVIDVYYTSTFTNNLAYRILYKSNLPMSESRASKNVYINNLKIYDFWRQIDFKYGAPDNTTEVKWGLGGKKPYLQAKTGSLELVDPILKELDASRMLNEDARLGTTPYYNF